VYLEKLLFWLAKKWNANDDDDGCERARLAVLYNPGADDGGHQCTRRARRRKSRKGDWSPPAPRPLMIRRTNSGRGHLPRCWPTRGHVWKPLQVRRRRRL